MTPDAENNLRVKGIGKKMIHYIGEIFNAADDTPQADSNAEQGLSELLSVMYYSNGEANNKARRHRIESEFPDLTTPQYKALSKIGQSLHRASMRN